MKKKILVTGGTGYIGSHTCVELIKKGYEVIIADNLSNSEIAVLDGIELITGIKPIFRKINLSDFKQTEIFFNEFHDIDTVIHFAALKAVGESVSFPLKYYENNIFSLVNVLKCMEKHKINKIVFSSSCTVYGQPDIIPVTEQTPIKPAESPYGNTKQISEAILKDYCISNPEFKAIALRYFNPIGAHASGFIGELPLGTPTNLVPFVTQTAYGIRLELLIFGKDYNTPDGTAIRDYIHVCDLAAAHVAAINRFDENISAQNFEFFNVGTGSGTSVLEIVNSFIEISGIKLNFRFTDRRSGDIEKIWADTSYSEKVLKFKTEYSIKEALESAWNWEKYYRKNLR